MTASRLPLRLAALALVFGSAAAVAQPVGQPARGKLTPEQWQKVFPEHRQLAIRDHQARIAILQRGERCIRSAGNAEALRSCRMEERRAFQEHRSRHKDQMRKLFQSKGVPLPEWGKRGGRRGGGDW